MKIILIVLISIISFSAFSQVKYVAPTSSGTGDGSSWTNATDDVQAAINLIEALGSGQVWVQAGTYTLDASLSLKENVEVYGGFVGNETLLTERDFLTNISILKGNITSNPIMRTNNSEGKLDGFTFEQGLGTNGIQMSTSSNSVNVEISNCIFSDFTGNSSCILLSATTNPLSPTIQNCYFSNNNSGANGAAISISVYSEATYNGIISNNQFINNTSSNNGGAVSLYSYAVANGTISNNVFKYNKSINEGAALYMIAYSGDVNTEVSYNTFAHNVAEEEGGAIHIHARDGTMNPFINANTIYNNSAKSGGAIHNVTRTATSTPIISNNVIFNNTANNGGAAIFIRDWSEYTCTIEAKLINNTIVNNYSGGIVLYLHGAGTHATTISNCILWNNESGEVGDQMSTAGVTPVYTNCNFMGGERNMSFDVNNDQIVDGNPYPSNSISCDPAFISPISFCGTAKTTADSLALESANWNLQQISPCINMADASLLLPQIDKDILGNDRTLNDTPDIGAYEYNGSLPAAPVLSNYIAPVSLPILAGDDNVIEVQASNTSGFRWQIFNGSGWEYLRDTVPFYGTGLSELKLFDIGMEYDNAVLRCEVFNAKGTIYTADITLDMEVYPNNVIYVTENGANSADGTSWANALPKEKIQSAIWMMNHRGGGEVWVAAGTYYPTEMLGMYALSEIRYNAILLRNNVKFYGGFAGNESSLTERDYRQNETILSGDIGIENDVTDNCFSVVVSYEECSNETLIDGFTVTGANQGTEMNSPSGQGGAIALWSYLGINNTVVRNNIIEKNNMPSLGAGICVVGYYHDAMPLIENNIIRNNTGPTAGVYMLAYGGSIDAGFHNNLISNNSGAGLKCESILSTCTADIINNTIVNNQINGIDISSDTKVCNAVITNNIIWGNTQNLYSLNSTATVGYNNIDNTASNVVVDGTGGFTYELGSFEATNIAANPEFMDPSTIIGQDMTAGINWHLSASSPGIDNGDNSSVPATIAYDLDGKTRIFDGDANGSTNVDMGVYEYNASNDVTPPETPILADLTNQCSISATAPTTTDDYAGTVTGTTTDPTEYIEQGSYVITWNFDDGNGNSINVDQNVIISDVTNPVPDNATLADINAECEVALLTAPTATDNCAGAITGTHDATLPITTQGTTTVTWTYADGNGNSITQTQDIVIEDVTNPVPDVATLSDVTAECEVTSLTAPTATDNCAGAITGTHDATLPITTQGTTVVTWTYADGNGNTITQTQDVVIEDVTNPVPDVATLSDVTAQCEVTSLTAPTASDNCAGAITGTHDATLPITAQGTTTVTWTYDDGNGNSITQTQDVVIEDVTNPVPDVATLSDVTAECEVTSLTAPTAIDNCAGAITGTHDATLPITAQGTTTVTWTYADGNGNTITQTQDVVIEDVTNPAPDVATLSDVTAECEVTSLTAPTASDNCAGAITGTHDATLPITAQGTTTVTWTYADGNGNTITQTQDVVIEDVTNPAPDVATLSDVTAECEVTSLTAPTATDNCTGAITGTHDATLPITAQGTTAVTWTYADGNGNTNTQTQDVIIEDVTNPVPDVATLSDVTAECEVTSLTAPTAIDNCAGAITGTHDATLPITTQGTTTVTWTYADGNGNSITQTQDVIIEDVTNPVPDVATLSDITAQCEVTSLTAPTATDNCSGAITGTHSLDLPITASTTVTWTYEDGAGNTSTQTQEVIIADQTAPVADLVELDDVTAQCEVTSLTAPTATDNCAGAITGTHNATLPITAQGTITVTWTYADGNGNTNTQTQDVVIEDVTNPVPDVATLSDVTAECEVTSLTAPTATDNCAGAVTGTHDATLPIVTQGTTTVTWTYADGNGNSITQTQEVIIADQTAPVADLVELDDITAQCEVTTLTAPTATDNCAGAITGTHNATLPITTQGTTTVTWTYADGNGNTITQTQDVVIEDVTNPTLTCTQDQEVDADETHIYTVQGSEFDPTGYDDNCEVESIENDFNSTETLAGAELPEGTTTIVWTVTDIAGNSDYCELDVVVIEYVGIGNFDVNAIGIYPNPFSNDLVIDAKGYSGEIRFEIYNSMGHIIYQDDIIDKSTVNTSSFSPGVYLIKLENGNAFELRKIIKQ